MESGNGRSKRSELEIYLSENVLEDVENLDVSCETKL